MVYKFFDKKSALLEGISASGGAAKNKNMTNQELAEELHKTIIRKLEKRKVYWSFIENIFIANLLICN